MEEKWKDIPGYKDRYKVSNKGRVISKKFEQDNKRGVIFTSKEIVLRPIKSSDGYLAVQLYGKHSSRLLIHRLVAEAFILNPEDKPCVNHKDGNKKNNRVENLEWCTHSENRKHAFDIGLINADGENNSQSKLTEIQVLEIRATWPFGWFTQKQFAKAYNVDPSLISRIIRRKIWQKI